MAGVKGESPHSPEFYTTPEVAKLFRVAVKTVERWIRDGRLPRVRSPGGRYLVPRDAVEAAYNPPPETADTGCPGCL
jgi:excisionase family DNA binding protein